MTRRHIAAFLALPFAAHSMKHHYLTDTVETLKPLRDKAASRGFVATALRIQVAIENLEIAIAEGGDGHTNGQMDGG